MREKVEKIMISREMKTNLKRAVPYTQCKSSSELARVAIALHLQQLRMEHEIEYVPYIMATGRG